LEKSGYGKYLTEIVGPPDTKEAPRAIAAIKSISSRRLV